MRSRGRSKSPESESASESDLGVKVVLFKKSAKAITNYLLSLIYPQFNLMPNYYLYQSVYDHLNNFL